MAGKSLRVSTPCRHLVLTIVLIKCAITAKNHYLLATKHINQLNSGIIIQLCHTNVYTVKLYHKLFSDTVLPRACLVRSLYVCHMLLDGGFALCDCRFISFSHSRSRHHGCDQFIGQRCLVAWLHVKSVFRSSTSASPSPMLNHPTSRHQMS